MRRYLLLLPALLFAALAATLGLGLNRDPSILPSQLIGQPIPPLALTPVRAGEPALANNDLKGRVVLLNVFASWCGACRVEHPTLMRLAREQQVALVGLDWKDDTGRCRELLAQTGDPYEKLGADESGRAGIDLGVTGAPETFVIDPAGRVRYRQVGPITEDVWRETIEPLVRRIRAEES